MEKQYMADVRRNGWMSLAFRMAVVLLLLCSFSAAHAQGKKKIAAPLAPSKPTVTITVTPVSSPSYASPATINVQADAIDNINVVTNIKLYKDGVQIGNLAGDSVQATVSNLAAGNYTFTANATNDVGGTAGATKTVTITQGNVPPTVSLTSPTNGQTFTTGNVVTLSATASDSDGTVSQVGFYVDGNLVGTSTTAPYSVAWTSVAGTHSVYARATDNSTASTNSGTVSITVNPPPNVPPTISLTSPTNGQSFTTGNVVTLSANAADSDGSVSQIGFYVDGSLVGTGTAAPYSVAWTSTVGSHSIYARATDNSGAATNSGAVSIAVNDPPTDVATFIAQSVPASLLIGQTTTVNVQMRNDGNTTWTAAGSYRLGSQNPQDNGIWGTGRVELPGSIAPGQAATFSFSIQAPTTPGTYNFQWRMVRDGVAWFGGVTTNVAIQVTVPQPPASETPTPTSLPAGAGSFSKIESITYSDNTAKWVMGQVASVTDVPTGLMQSATTYDSTTAMPTAMYTFGKLQSTLAYNADGTLATIKDGRNNTTTFTSWMRGIPQSIQYADSTAKSAVVSDAGWIMSITDENGYATGYGYDATGFLTGITYPTGDSVTWANTTRNFVAVASAEYGIAAGHWRLTETTGNAVKITYYDALWRPLLVREYDAANVAATERFTSMAYDALGRVSFVSYPATASNPTTGVWTLYDTLGRVTSVSQDSEQNLLTTTTEYLGGFQTRVTNPRGFQTITGYMAYDQPSNDWPLVINAPDSATTTISRDPFGKPTAITRSGGGTSVTRSYSYNAYQELCRSVEPEVGATLFAYDAAGNLASSAAGLDPATACGASNSRTVNRTYDARNRITGLWFPDSKGSQSWQYTPDGLVASSIVDNDGPSAGSVDQTYTYNRRRLLTGESLSQRGWYTWNAGYGYDANGHLASQGYPTGLVVNYSPNALGQPTTVTSTDGWTYASGISYYPNGAIKQFTYGNGIVHTMSQNARQLPGRSTDAGVINYGFSYDANGNPTVINDDVRGSYYNRTMSYDGLDRLLGAASPRFGGDGVHRFTYNPQDNITSWKLAGVKDYASYIYDASNRLTNIQNNAGASVVALAYDLQGNLQNKNGQNYVFDYSNRLREASGKEWYRYDGYGRRVLEWGATEPGILPMYGQSGQLLYDENYYSSGRKATEYVYLSGSLISTRARNIDTNAWTVSFQHTDALGSPVAVTNTAGVVVDRTDWEPYGAAIGKPNYGGVGYTGHVMDSATGLAYMQQRYYDPTIGRFLSTDPVEIFAGGGQHFNRYDYAYNNPYKLIDADGRAAGDPYKWASGDFSEEGTSSSKRSEASSSVSTPAGIYQKPVAEWTDDDWREWNNKDASDLLNTIGSPLGIFVDAYNKDYKSAAINAIFLFIPEGRGSSVTHLHHAWPKYLGGPLKQDLVRLSKPIHDLYHSGLDKILPRQWSAKYYQALTGPARAQVMRDLATYTKAFDAKYGTNLYEMMVKNGFKVP